MTAGARKGPAAWIRDLQVRTPGPVHVQVAPDVGVRLPVEVFVEHGPGYVDAEALGLSAGLEEALTQWQRWWAEHIDWDGAEVVGGDDREWQAWQQQGEALIERLRGELGAGFHVHSR